jgi:flagellar basal-body rod protein FlgC
MDNLSTASQISSAGMTAQRKRVEVSISNLVNSNTTQAEGKEPVGRKDVVFSSEAPVSASFKKTMDTAMEDVQSVKISQVVTDTREPIKRYEPNHPHANKDGYVLYPNINPMEEMINVTAAARSYQANLEARKSAGGMKNNALDILK